MLAAFAIGVSGDYLRIARELERAGASARVFLAFAEFHGAVLRRAEGPSSSPPISAPSPEPAPQRRWEMRDLRAPLSSARARAPQPAQNPAPTTAPGAVAPSAAAAAGLRTRRGRGRGGRGSEGRGRPHCPSRTSAAPTSAPTPTPAPVPHHPKPNPPPKPTSSSTPTPTPTPTPAVPKPAPDPAPAPKPEPTAPPAPKLAPATPACAWGDIDEKKADEVAVDAQTKAAIARFQSRVRARRARARMSDAPASPAKKPRVRPDSPAPFPPADALVKPSIQIELADDPDARPARISLKRDAPRPFATPHVYSKRDLVWPVRLRACGYASDDSDRSAITDFEGPGRRTSASEETSDSESEYASDGVIGSNGRLRI